jgi:hypothetical protein
MYRHGVLMVVCGNGLCRSAAAEARRLQAAAEHVVAHWHGNGCRPGMACMPGMAAHTSGIP